MKIKIYNYIIETNDSCTFDMYERKKSTNKTSKNGYIRTGKTYYGITLERAVTLIAHLTLNNNPLEVTLSQFLTEYKNECKRIRKLVDLELLQ